MPYLKPMNITVLGAGQMGAGIAQVFATHGHPVTLLDLSPAALERGRAAIADSLDRLVRKERLSAEERAATLGRIRDATDLAAAAATAELVVEAATEDTDLKLRLFADLDRHAPPGCLLATNTSSISITRLAAATGRPADVIGMHFMNPVPVMKLVEVIRGHSTSDATTATVLALAEALGKTPVEVNDYPGFVANRILMPMINEAIHTLWEGVGTAEAIDTVMRLGMAHPMGPLQLADYIGLDTCLAILEVMYAGFRRPHYAPCPLLVNMVRAGKLGRKSGEGFYRY